jgi:dCMP deaminase
MDRQRKKDKLYLDIAERFSKESNCISFKVGCVIVKDGRIISSGYNGTPSGFINCNEKFADWNEVRFGPGPSDAEKKRRREEHHEWSNNFEIHSEMNCLLYAAKYGICIDGATIYSTVQPCNQCLKNIIQSGIKRIVYHKLYDKVVYDSEILELIESSGIKLDQI